MPLHIYIIGGVGGCLLQLGLLGGDMVVTLASIGRQKHPVGRYGVVVQLVLRTRLVGHDHHGTRMGHAGGDAHEYRQLLLFAEVEGSGHHVVGFLLTGRLEGGNHGKLAIEARVLLVLTGVHGGVVGSEYDHAAIDTRHATIDEGVGADVHAHVLHAHQRTLAHERHAQGLFHGRLLVGTPTAVNAALAGQRIALNKLCDFCRWGAGIGVDA